MENLCGGHPCDIATGAQRAIIQLDQDIDRVGTTLLSYNEMMVEAPELSHMTAIERDETLASFDALTSARDSVQGTLDRCIGCTGMSNGMCSVLPIE
jgi:hypothetical protein